MRRKRSEEGASPFSFWAMERRDRMNVMEEAEQAVRRYERMSAGERAGRLERAGIEVLASRDRQKGSLA